MRAEPRQSGESEAGIQQLERQLGQPDTAVHSAIGSYLAAVDRIRRAHGGMHSIYPGSPLLAAASLRDVDQALCAEAQPQTARALQRTFERSNALLAMTPRVASGDGYQEVKRQLPPALRRGLVFIDPPYEAQDEEQQIATTLAQGLTRFETGVFALWYPIKRQHETDLWLSRILRGITRPTLAVELCLSAPDHGAGLNGSGMLIINPPLAVRCGCAGLAGRTARAARRQLRQHRKMAGA